MTKKFFSRIFILFFAILLVDLTAYSASYYYDDGTASDNPDVNKFVPQSGVKIKESRMAEWMENSTRNAMNGKEKTSSSKQIHKPQKNTPTNYQKSYKWF